MNVVWMGLALACYGLATAAFIAGRRLLKASWNGFAVPLLGAGALFHGLALIARGIQAGSFPVTNFPEALSFLAWLTAVGGLLLVTRFGMAVIGAFVAPAALAGYAVASMMMKQRRFVIPESLRSAWLPIHVTLAILGEALFVLAAGVSVLYLVYESRLKGKRMPGPGAEHVPSLEKLDRLNYRLLGWGFLMLSLAMISGAIWADASWGHFWSWEPQESWSLIIWLLYAGLLESRLTVGWQGRRAAALTIVVFAVLVGSLLGVSLISPGKHGGNFG